MPTITEANRQALREWWADVKGVLSDPLLYVTSFIVAFVMCIPWLVDEVDLAWEWLWK